MLCTAYETVRFFSLIREYFGINESELVIDFSIQDFRSFDSSNPSMLQDPKELPIMFHHLGAHN